MRHNQLALEAIQALKEAIRKATDEDFVIKKSPVVEMPEGMRARLNELIKAEV